MNKEWNIKFCIDYIDFYKFSVTGDRKIKMVVEDLMEGRSFCSVIDKQIVFNEIDDNQDAVWSLLLAGGY